MEESSCTNIIFISIMTNYSFKIWFWDIKDKEFSEKCLLGKIKLKIYTVIQLKILKSTLVILK